jgi:crotonobetainyl-CoA:carnitine CoA-transferase CaiB-like acyl-CoA transferase
MMPARFSPLSGIRVIDFSKVLAGPLCTQYLGDLGADVIKVEPFGGDDTRSWPPFADGDGAVFLSCNKNKRSIAVDLKSPGGLALVKKLVVGSDIVVESFRTGVTQRLGIDYRTLSQIKPDLIYASISGFGRSGPLAAEPGYDLMIQAFSGIMSITGEKGRGPVRSAFSPIDQTTGIHLALGILAALRERDNTRKGQLIEASLFETALSFLAYTAQSYWISGRVPARFGSAHESLCPYQVFRAADGDILIAIGNDKLWRGFCPVSGLDEYVDHPNFATNSARVKHFEETVRIVSATIETRRVKEWVSILTAAGIPHSPICTVPEALASEQTVARNMVVELQHPAIGNLNAIAMPLLFDGFDRSPRSAPPRVGEHSLEIISELGIEREEAEALIAQGAVRISANM